MTAVESVGDVVRRPATPADAPPALRVAGDAARSVGRREFGATARKAGNYLRYRGVGESGTAALAADAAPPVAAAFFGVALLGARARFVEANDDAGDVKVLLAPTAALDRYAVPDGAGVVGYGDPPEDPAAGYFERDVWSENPTFPPTSVGSETPLLVTAGRTFANGDVLDAARRVAADLNRGEEVAVRASLARPGTVAAGLVAPLLAGATALFPADGVVGDVAVATGDTPEARVVNPADVL